ncbi:uncharacterized protein [Physcomitrium patens]|uniref:uncharacterized protein isoform X1 n=2 Tax=Physcomitrium patens TaxID=3218 RepID=UPI000D1792ED|nr:uncharacterized protein LOC112274193 isoform X1 [Physcomitrium patens]|eukprot:XP_024359209.1 uncharacterized protein LOC112274193 isoform X1 [Physcomitrella patens]
MNDSMAERTAQELGSLIQKPYGLMSPERSGSPDLKLRSSQRKRDRAVCASREDAYQIDVWPGADGRKSEDVLVRYKDTRGSLSSRMDPHAWSDLPTDTDDELDDNAVASSDGKGYHGGKFSPKFVSSKPDIKTVHRMTRSEVKIWSLASEESWDRPREGIGELDGSSSQQESHLPDTENKCDEATKLLTCVATLREFSKASSLEYQEKDSSREHEVNDAGEKLEGGLECVLMRVSTHASLSKVIDEQASIKMSRRYYSSGSSNSSRRRSMPRRVAAQGGDSGEKSIRSNRRQIEESGMLILADSRSKTQRVAVNEVDSFKELAESTTSADSDCNDMEYSSGGADNEDDIEENYRQMALHKHLKLHGKTVKKRWSKIKVFAGQFKATATDQAQTGVVKERRPVSRSINSTFQDDPVKNPYSVEPPDTRQISPQLAESLQEDQSNIRSMKSIETREAMAEEKLPHWLRDELQHFGRSADICALKVPASQSRGGTSPSEMLTEEERCTVDFDRCFGKNSKIADREASKESCFVINGIFVKNQEVVCPPTLSERHSRFENSCISAVDFTPNTKDSPLKNNESQEATSPKERVAASVVPCDRLPHPMVLTTIKADGVQRSGAVEETLVAPEYQCEVRDMEQCQRLGSPVLDCKSGSKDEAAVEMLNLDCGDGEGTHRAEVTHTNYCQGSAEESRNSFGEVRNFFADEVTAVVPFQSCDDDRSLPNVYLAFQPASLTVLELRNEVEETKHVHNEKQPKRILRVVEQGLGTETLSQHGPGLSEAGQNPQKEQQILLKHLQELNAHHPCNRLRAMSRTNAQLTEEDVRKLRQEILEQEALIRGYQVENEKAVAKLKEVQLDAKHKLQEMAEERAFLASQLSNRHMQSGHQSWVCSTESVSLNEALRSALSRESDLRIDLDKIRESYMELKMREKKEESGRIRDLESKLTALKEMRETEKQGHAQMEGIKQATRQQEELISSLYDTISNQASRIRLLTIKLESGGEAQGTTVAELDQLDHKQNSNNDMTQNQIETLRNQVKRLEASLRAAKKETGLHALEMSKSCVGENDKFRRLQMELVSIQRQALQKDEETNKILHRLKVENDKIKSETATRIRNLKQQTQAQAQNGHSVSENERAAMNRVKDLEKQLANLRIRYSRKLKDLTEKLGEAKQEPKSKDFMRSKMIPENTAFKSKVANTRLQPAQQKALREAKERILLTEDVLIQKDRTIKSLQNKLKTMEAARAGLCNKFSATGASAIIASTGEKQGSPTREVYCSEPEQLPSQESNNSRTRLLSSTSVAVDTADEVMALRMELEKSELTREVLQKACDESVEKAVFLTLQHQQARQLQQIRQAQMDCNSECQTSLAGWTDHRSDPEGMIWRSERSSLEMTNRALEARLKDMSEELEEAQSMFRQSPRMTQIMKLKKKVTEMEARQQQREIEWQNILEELKQASSKDQEYAEHKWHQAFDTKSKEVEKIRLELNSILETALSIQQAQIQKNH